MTYNPFPGPQPYRASDRARFFGREDASQKLEGMLLAGRCTTVYGPSGAGKSSLVQASVLPRLVDTRDVRIVRVDGWPEDQEPTQWLATAVYDELNLGEMPGDMTPRDAILTAAKRVSRGSSRLMILYLDQMEQLLYPSRDAAQVEAFFDCVGELVELPLRSVRVVLSLREDYLGRFRERLRDYRRILEHGFRVGPMTVEELAEAVCQAATSGEPPQSWSREAMRALMRQVRIPGQSASNDAEAQSAYAQIVCRALFQERASGKSDDASAIEAEPILRRYLENSLSELGALRGTAQRLLEDHLVTIDGSRTVRTENELLRLVEQTELGPILKALESAAILHAEEHQGSRYFEIGHDWLARKVFEERQTRELAEAQRNREEEHRRALEKARKERRALLMLLAAAVAVAVVTGSLGYWAWMQKKAADAARREAERQEHIARARESEAHDASILAGFRELRGAGKLAWGMKLLPEVDWPAERRGWVGLASDALKENALQRTFTGHEGPLSTALWLGDAKRILTASSDGTARIWNIDGFGEPVVLAGHRDAIRYAATSPDGKRILTASDDGTVRIWAVNGKDKPLVFEESKSPVIHVTWSPDGQRIATASLDGIVRIHRADGGGTPVLLDAQAGPVTCVLFDKESKVVLAATNEGTVVAFGGDGKPKKIQEHKSRIGFLAWNRDGDKLVSTSLDGTAHVFGMDGKGPAIVLTGHQGAVLHAAWSSDGSRIATASSDHTVRIWNADGTGEAVVLRGHTQAVEFVAFRKDGAFIATASSDKTARIWRSNGGSSFVLQGHDAGVKSIAWSPDESALVTAAEDASAKVWRAESISSLGQTPDGAGVLHAASFDKAGTMFVAAYDDQKARLIRLDGSSLPIVFAGHEGWVTSATVSPQGDRVVTTSFDRTARVWKSDGNGDSVGLAGHEAEVRYAVFSPDGQRILTIADDRKARIFQANGQGAPVVLSGHGDGITNAAWSMDGSRVVTTSFDQTARVFFSNGEGEPVVIAAHGNAVTAAAFLSDGQRIVTASLDGFVRVFRLGHAEPTASMSFGGNEVRVLAASPNGEIVAMAATDGSVRVWWPKKNRWLTFDAPAPIAALTFVDEGRQVLAVAVDHSVHRWMVDVDALTRRLFAAHEDCVPIAIRVELLRESPDVARTRYETCEKNPIQVPPYLAERHAGDFDSVTNPAVLATPIDMPRRTDGGPKELASDMRRVKVIVLPGEAVVEVEGTQVTRRGGIVEFVGKVGERRKVRAQKGDQFLEVDVSITEAGASPAIVDLAKKMAEREAAMRAKPTKKDAFAPLVTEKFE